MARFRTLDELAVKGRRVLVRSDLNVPMQDGKVSDATRIAHTAVTLRELAGKGARVVVLSHFGRPEGKPVAKLSQAPLAAALAAALGGRTVGFAADCVGPAAAAAVAGLPEGGVLLLENVRFHAGEEANDPVFAGRLAELGDIYVNDAFSCAHRAHASTEGLARLLPAAAGRGMEAELKALEGALGSPARPVMAVVGGAKVSTKLSVLGNLLGRVEQLAIGGGMANTFLHARGLEVGKSLCERDLADTAREIEAKARAAGTELVLPADVVLAKALKPGVDTATVVVEKVPADMLILDIGPRAVLDLQARLERCRTVVWNGPLGAFETQPFDRGTNAVARHAGQLSRAGKLLSVAGGGDTVAALNHAGAAQDFSYVSTAGGAFLEWLEGKTLPGVKVLMG
ncbi:MAG: phosphoglycerate kinase [Alphaproteobacteria bacterium]|nr:phosphoglycerate kinase [Alphaproteobacteria bacterium]